MRDIHSPRPASGAFWLTPPGTRPEPMMVWVAERAEALDPGDAAWLRDALDPPSGETRVGAVVPLGYEAYARVLHPARRGVGADEVPVRWEEVARWAGRVMHPEVQWEAVSRPRTRPASRRPWDSEPVNGLCPAPLRRRLVELLRPFTTSDWCCAAVWEGWGATSSSNFPELPLLSLPFRRYLLLRAPWELVAGSIFGGDAAQDTAPSLWWPPDRAWCVATEVDFRWTYVGGPRAAIERILEDPTLEALPTDPDHRGDYLGDTINGPVGPY